MALEDSKAPFMRIPWAASLLKRPDTILRVPESRKHKATGEDSLFAETLKTPRTFRSCICFYIRPPPDQDKIEEISTLITLGDGISGHIGVMHGGVVATVLDEAMGILQAANYDRDHLAAVGKGLAPSELPLPLDNYTAQLNIRYLRPVKTPGALIATARLVKRKGRKEWISAEIKQREGADEDCDGNEVVCATAEALFIEARKNKL